MDKAPQSGDMSFAHALNHIMNGVRMRPRFLPENMFIELQKPDENSMNSEPYLKLVEVQEGGADGPRIAKCEPWEPGRRSLFDNTWHTSRYQSLAL